MADLTANRPISLQSQKQGAICMSENSTLIGYEGRTISREELALVPTPLATETHRPEGDDRAGLEIGNHIHASSTGSSATLFHSGWPTPAQQLALRQPTCHQLLPRPATVLEPRSPWPGGVCAASSKRSHIGKDRADAAEVEQTRHACRWSSNMPPRTNESGGSWSGAGWSRMSTKLGAGICRIGGEVGSPVHRLSRAHIGDK